MKHKFLLLYTWFVRSLLFFWPDIPMIMRLRGWLYGLGMEHCGHNFQVTHDARLTSLEDIIVGNDVFVGNMSLIFAHGTITFEDQVMIGPLCMISGGNHTKENGSFRMGEGVIGDVTIGYGSWVAANSTVTAGATLPRGSVLGANSVLTRSFDKPDSLYAGVPAKLIK